MSSSNFISGMHLMALLLLRGVSFTSAQTLAPTTSSLGGNETAVPILISYKPTLQDKLDAARSIWNGQAIANYSFEYKRVSASLAPQDFMVQVENNNNVTSAVDKNTGLTASAGQLAYIPTIDGIFDEIQQAINNNVTTINVTYNAKFSYPQKVFISNIRLPDASFRLTVITLTPYSLYQQQLITAMALWDQRAMEDYNYSVTISCFTALCGIKYSVVVRNYKLVSVTNAATGVLVTGSLAGTIEDLFTLIQSYITSRAYYIYVKYDTVYGYPSHITIDPSQNIRDENIGFVIPHLIPIRNTPAQKQLKTERALWNSKGYKNYTYNYQKYCGLCPTSFPAPGVSVQVKKNIVTRALFQASHSPVPSTEISLIPSINGIFDQIQNAINLNAYFSFASSFRVLWCHKRVVSPSSGHSVNSPETAG